mgnify:CR=1 FL=1|tara:strand:+ start:722 stop:1270 length:549 start_codon:yes stop_codon:yes gene_type:complete
MASKLQLDRFFLISKKDLEGKSSFLDKRKFRAQQTPREKAIKLLTEALEKIGVTDSAVLANDLMKIKKIYQMNKLLLCIVYKYYESKNFSMKNVVKNFDEDFENQVNNITNLGIFKKLTKKKNTIFKFRQDFIIYLFIVHDFYNNYRTDEEYYDYEDDGSYDTSYVDIDEEELTYPDDAGYD